MKKKILILLCIIMSLLLCGCGKKAKSEQLAKYGKEQFLLQDYDSYIKKLRESSGIYDLEADPTVSFYDFSYDSNTKTLDANCLFIFKSDEIDKYLNSKSNDSNARNLMLTLKDLKREYDNKVVYTYSSEKGTIRLKIENYYDTVEVISKAGNKYRYSDVGNYDDASINGKTVYLKENEEAIKTNSNSYNGKYDAKLRYGSGPVLIFASEDAMDRYFTAMAKGYEGSIDELFRNGEVASTEENTKCNIIKEKITRAQVMLLDGSNAGSTVWVVTESIQK